MNVLLNPVFNVNRIGMSLSISICQEINQEMMTSAMSPIRSHTGGIRKIDIHVA